MHKNQKLRLIQEISFMLQLSQPAIGTVLHFYRKFNQAQEQSKTDSDYSNEVIVGACIFLTAKIFQNERKIRDILNTIYSAIKVYQLAKSKQNQQQKQSNYIQLNTVLQTQSTQQILHSMQPSYDLATYSQLKKQVLQAEQQLLKIIKFDFTCAENKSNNFKQLLAVCDRLRLKRNVVQIAVNVYNDLQIGEQVAIWVPGIVYFANQIAAVQAQINIQTNVNTNNNDSQEQPCQNKNNQEIKVVEQAQQNNETLNLSKIPSTKQEHTQDIANNKKQIIQWQRLFLVPVKKLQAYSQKIVCYYEALSQEQQSK